MADGRRRREPGQLGDGDARCRRRARRRTRPQPEPSTTATSWRSTPVRSASASAAAAARAYGSEGDRHGWDPTIQPDAHHRVAWRPRRPDRPDPAAPRRRVAGGARRRHDDRRHPPAGRARRAGDRRGRRVRRRPGRPAGRAGGPRRGLRPGRGRARSPRPGRRRSTCRGPCGGSSPTPTTAPTAVVAEAVELCEEDVRTNRALAERGAELLEELCRRRRCACTRTATPAGWRASSGGPRWASCGRCTSGARCVSVTADETRPLLQGARLTAFELVQLGIEHRIVVDGAGPSVIARGLADAVVVGADRIAANGDVANKIGTYPLALAAARAGIPFVVAAPESTLDPATPTRRRHRDRGARSPTRCSASASGASAPGRVAGAEPGVRRHPGRPRDGDRDRAPGDPPGARRAPVSDRGRRRPCARRRSGGCSTSTDRVVVVTGVSRGHRARHRPALRRGRRLARAALPARPRARPRCWPPSSGERATVVVGDLLEPGVADGVAAAAVERFGRLDVWVSNAGVQPVAGLHGDGRRRSSPPSSTAT